MDVAGSPAAIIEIWERVSDGALSFTREPDDKIAFDAPQGFRILIDLIEIGAGYTERIHATKPLYDGSVASVSDLLLLRAVTVVDRGSNGDVVDFQWLLSEVAKAGNFPEVDDEELEYLLKAVEPCLGQLGCLVVAALIGSKNTFAALRLLSPMK